MSAAARVSRGRLPWATLVVAFLAIAIHVMPGTESWLALDRARTFRGELWRLWTCHLVHFGSNHLLWNVLVVSVAGGWVESLAPTRTRWFYPVAAVAISVSLLVFAPEMTVYAGLSGLGVGVVLLLALQQAGRTRGVQRWMWGCAAPILLGKVFLELTGAVGPWTRFSDSEVRFVPLAHLAGLLCAAAFHAGAVWRARRLGASRSH